MHGVEECGSGILSPDDQLVVDALKGFCCASEQSYNQFLVSSTQLSPGSARSGQIVVQSALTPLSDEMERSACNRERRRNGVVEAVEDAQLKEHDCVLAADQGQLESYLEVEDISQEDEDVIPDSGEGFLPGEVEEDVPAFLPSFCHCTQLEMTSTASGQSREGPGQGEGHRPAQRPGQGQQATLEEQGESADVFPFSLDEDFDYDHVMLSRKHPLLNPNGT